MNPWLIAGGLALIKSLSDEKNRKAEIAVNAAKEKYSPWTGQNGNFAGLGSSKTAGNFMSAAGSALLSQSMAGDAKAATGADVATKENLADADYYSKLSKDPSSVGVTPIGGASRSASAFAAAPAAMAASRSPALAPAAESKLPSQASELPAFMQGSNPWATMAQKPLGPYQPQYPMQPQDPTAVNRAWAWNNLIPDNSPIKRGY